MPENSNPNRARDHLANERTFLAWVRTGVATIIFGFAIGRFSIALREFMKLQGYTSVTPGFTTWLGIISAVGGVLLLLAGLGRYRKTRMQLDRTPSSPPGS
jgi:putative membrane protein